MLRFFGEISKLTGLPFNEVTTDFKVIFLGGGGVFVSNYIKILVYNTEQLSLKVKNNVLNIDGKNLNIKRLSKNEIIVKGSVNKIYLSREYK